MDLLYLNTFFCLEEGFLFCFVFLKPKWSGNRDTYDQQCQTQHSSVMEWTGYLLLLWELTVHFYFWLLSFKHLLLFGQEDIFCQGFIPCLLIFFRSLWKVKNLWKSSGLYQLDFTHPHGSCWFFQIVWADLWGATSIYKMYSFFPQNVTLCSWSYHSDFFIPDHTIFQIPGSSVKSPLKHPENFLKISAVFAAFG